jgi:hypothetical protein
MVEELLQRYGPSLQRWPHPKIVTGRAVGALLRGADPAALTAPDGALRPAALDRIARRLGRWLG